MKKNIPVIPAVRRPRSAQVQADDRFMEMAFAQALSAKGRTLPNPPVGAVLVKRGVVIGVGATRPAGQAHAEIVALENARASHPSTRGKTPGDVLTPKDANFGATLYVTLEPCNHFGRTPPCTQGIIAAGVTRVVAACPDPNPKVAGRGFATLRRAGIKVEVASRRPPPSNQDAQDSGSEVGPKTSVDWRARAEEFYEGFFFWIRQGRPRIVVKIAQSLDGRINAQPGVETALTGQKARRHAHALRSRADAILVGAETLRIDDPDLTPRLVSQGRGGPAPDVIVVSRTGHLPPGLKVFSKRRSSKTWVLAPKKPKNLPPWVGFVPLPPSSRDAKTLAPALMKFFVDQGFHEVLVEGGRGVWRAFLDTGLCDALHVITSPCLLPGGEAWAKDLSTGWAKPLEFHRFTPLDRDSLIEFRRRVSAR